MKSGMKTLNDGKIDKEEVELALEFFRTRLELSARLQSDEKAEVKHLINISFRELLGYKTNKSDFYAI